ncbi:hypothetical protein BX600DRAFT_385525, partial [Xylariales sp. PMI_506]
SWLLLAGYLVFPSTFSSLSNAKILSNTGKAENYIVAAVQNVPLLYIASFCCGIATTGLIWLWIKWSQNYVFLINRIIEPILVNSAMGFVSTLLNVYTVQSHEWSVTAIVTGAITGACFLAFTVLFIVYDQHFLQKLREDS